jgi:hypothetical protein
LPDPTHSRGFFAGLAVPYDSDARRQAGGPVGTTLESLGKLAQRHRNIQRLIAGSAERSGAVAWLAQVEDLTRDLNPSAAGNVLYQLAQQYRCCGQPELAADALSVLVERYPNHPLADAALVWLIPYFGSSEVETYVGASRPARIDYLAALRGSDALAINSAAGDFASRAPNRRPVLLPPVQTPDGARVPESSAGRADRALALGMLLKQSRPALFAEPRIQFALAAAQRRRAPLATASGLETLAHGQLALAWQQCARGEQWLAESRGMPPKSTLECRRAQQRPRLDGALDDPVWQQAAKGKLSSARNDDAQWPAEIQLAYDAEFLFLALRCGKALRGNYPPSDGPRCRDADLSAHDRFELLLDVDRDYASYYRLCVDHRGWAAESCYEDEHWNPQWFVAASADEAMWTVEAAVPLNKLTARPPTARDVWSVGFQRTVPGVGFQAWTRPAAIEVAPEGFGYLLFR